MRHLWVLQLTVGCAKSTPVGVTDEEVREKFAACYVSHVPVDHTSVTRLVETRFDLPALTRRDANAWPLLDMFDFEHPDLSVPELPEAVIDAQRDEQCKREFP